MRTLRSLMSLLLACASAIAQGAYTGSTVVPVAGDTMTLSQPTDGSSSTTATTLEISDQNKTYKRNVDYVVTGLPGQTPVIEWLTGKRPKDGTTLTIAGDTAAQGSFTTTVTWS